MQNAATILNIDLRATTMRDFTIHFERSFCDIKTFKPDMRELIQVSKTNVAHQPFDYIYRQKKMTDEEYNNDCGINFEKIDYRWEPKPILFTSWEVRGYGGRDAPVKQINCTLTIARYRTDRLRITLEDNHQESFPSDISGYNIDLFARIFRGWLEARWGKKGYGYVELPLENAPQHAVKWLPNKPPKPNSDGFTWDDVFDWWYRGGRLWLGYSNLKDLASDIGFVEGTVYNNHGNYVKEYGEQQMPDNKSKYVGMFPPMNIVHDNE